MQGQNSKKRNTGKALFPYSVSDFTFTCGSNRTTSALATCCLGFKKSVRHTVIGKKTKDQALLTLTERKTRKEIILRVTAKDSLSVSEVISQLKVSYGNRFSKVFKTITADNGSEFADLGLSVEKDLTEVYFTHPYTSCERGTNERHNGLIRRFIPKGRPISSVADETITYVENWRNHLPRKILNYRTPEECFQIELAGLAS